MWSKEVNHNDKASWLDDIILSAEDIRNGVNERESWRAAGPDLYSFQGYWLKKLKWIQRLQEYLLGCVCQENVPEWMVIEITVLIQNDPTKGNQASSLFIRPACLPLIWKLLTGIMEEKINKHLERNGLLGAVERDPEKRRINCL